MRRRALALGLEIALVGGAAARGDPRLDEIVYSPYVEPRVVEVETRVAAEMGPGELSGARSTVVELEAGISDNASLAIVTRVQRAPGAPDRATSVGVEGIYYLGQVPHVGIDVGGYLEFAKGLGGEADELEAKLLLAKTDGRFQGLVNLILERPLGAPEGRGFASYGYAASATWRVIGHWRLGAEALGGLGDDHSFLGRQGAYVGPQVTWQGRPGHLPVEFGLDAGWLAPIGLDRREARSQARLTLEIERRF